MYPALFLFCLYKVYPPLPKLYLYSCPDSLPTYIFYNLFKKYVIDSQNLPSVSVSLFLANILRFILIWKRMSWTQLFFQVTIITFPLNSIFKETFLAVNFSEHILCLSSPYSLPLIHLWKFHPFFKPNSNAILLMSATKYNFFFSSELLLYDESSCHH